MLVPISKRGALALLSATSATATALLPRDCKYTTNALEGDTCEILAKGWQISVETFASWNPGVDCEGPLEVGRRYCIELEGPGPDTTTSDSVTWGVTTIRPPPTSKTATTKTTTKTTTTTTTKKTTTTTTTKKKTTTTAPKPTPKPTTTTTTTKKPTTTTKQGIPSPTQPGTTPDCTQYHKVKDTDTCLILVDQYRTFTLAQFYSWNPNVGYDCREMWTGYYVCVAGKSSFVPPPGPTQPGVNPRCNKWYYVKSGDTCQDIAARYGISLRTFYNWNPSVGSDCRNMWAHNYVCIGSA